MPSMPWLTRLSDYVQLLLLFGGTTCRGSLQVWHTTATVSVQTTPQHHVREHHSHSRGAVDIPTLHTSMFSDSFVMCTLYLTPASLSKCSLSSSFTPTQPDGLNWWGRLPHKLFGGHPSPREHHDFYYKCHLSRSHVCYYFWGLFHFTLFCPSTLPVPTDFIYKTLLVYLMAFSSSPSRSKSCQQGLSCSSLQEQWCTGTCQERQDEAAAVQ